MRKRNEQSADTSVERSMQRVDLQVRVPQPLRQSFAADDPVLVAIRRVGADLDRLDSLQAQRDTAYRETLRKIVLRRSR